MADVDVYTKTNPDGTVYHFRDDRLPGGDTCIFPVGYIYMSVDSTDPGDFFGGTWERIQDAFLLAAGVNHSAGSTGGAETHTHTTGNHTLTEAEIPSHSHRSRIGYSESGYGNTIPPWSAYLDGSGSGPWGASGNNSIKGTNGSTTLSNRNTRNLAMSVATGGGGAHNHGNTGSGSNLPPYLAVYMWKRTA